MVVVVVVVVVVQIERCGTRNSLRSHSRLHGTGGGGVAWVSLTTSRSTARAPKESRC